MCDEVNQDFKNQEYKPDSSILFPDHPLLEKFQGALKEHLLNLIDRANGEINEIEIELTKKNVELETYGLQVYEQQQIVCNKQETLGKLIQNVKILREKCEQEEEELERNTQILKDIDEKLFDTRKTARELFNEIESVKKINNSLEDVENSIEGHLKVNKTIASKRREDNETLSKKKRYQDYLMHSLITELWKLEGEMETLELSAEVKREYIDDLEEQIAVGNTTISALETEYKCLLQSWNAAVVTIGHRDGKLEKVQKKLTDLRDIHKNLSSEIDSVRKQIKQTLVENDDLTAFRTNVQKEKERSEQMYQKELVKKEELLRDMARLEQIINETEKDIKKVREENKPSESKYEKLQREIDRLVEKKNTLQRGIETLLFQRTCNNNLTKKQEKIYEEIMDKRREVEIVLQRLINRSTEVYTEVAEQTLQNEELNNHLQEIRRDITALYTEQETFKKQLESQEYQYRKKGTKLKLLNEKLQKMLKHLEENKANPNQELKLLELAKLVEDRKADIKQLQQIWLCEQNAMIKLAKERQETIKMVNLKRKQTLMSDQKNIRIGEELEQIKREEVHVELTIKRHLVKLKRLCEDVYNKRNRKCQLDKDNIFVKNQFEDKLRDAELELLRIESDIALIEENKLTLSKDLIEINREALAWESKSKLAKGTLKESNEERDKGGQVNILKTKISQGKIFLGELRKSQEKILKELETCISRRESIFYKSEAKQVDSRSKTNQADITKINVGRKMSNIKNQIKQLNNEIQKIKKQIKICEEKKKETENNLSDISKHFRCETFHSVLK
ncbi:coiled-coil domain-containing protein 40-like isoform X2 [Diorhabda carinulata]|uniref:coiled-coil domain-containing protein 40-like isoform X2 n=1 Tax=Diorhabda carinulata TaxID=1163345 RepID=UPI0025A27579|nr:coiled-coil domain-containing protein 40-like isoform X2 [Diorhabda carinulata]